MSSVDVRFHTAEPKCRCVVGLMAAIKTLVEWLPVIPVSSHTSPTYLVALKHLGRQKVHPGLRVVLGRVEAVGK